MVNSLKDKIKNGELFLNGQGLKEIPLKEIVSKLPFFIDFSTSVHVTILHNIRRNFIPYCITFTNTDISTHFTILFDAVSPQNFNDTFVSLQAAHKHITAINLSNNKIASVPVSISSHIDTR